MNFNNIVDLKCLEYRNNDNSLVIFGNSVHIIL